MTIQTAYSMETNPEAAAKDIQSQLTGTDMRAVIFFASSQYPPEEISQAMQMAFAQTQTFGCSTAGEIVSGKMLKNSIVAMGLDATVLKDMNLQIVSDIQTENQVDQAFSRFSTYFNVDPLDMDMMDYVGIILVDGLRSAEERLMDRIGELSDIFFIGGSAGDDLKFEQTWVYANGKAYTNAALLAVLKPAVGFNIIKTQSFKACSKQLTATKVSLSDRKVIEFNNKPATEAYAEAIGTTVDQVEQYFMSHPVGLMIEDEPFVRSPQRIDADGMYFYCHVMEGMEMSILEASDIVKDTQRAVDKKISESTHISGIINFHCILRTLELEKTGLTQAYANIFSKLPTVGFSTYGEAFIGHINQTATMLMFE